MKTCPQCGRSYPDSEAFCEYDGAALNIASGAAGRSTTVMAEEEAAGVSTPLECPVCGGKAQPGEVICNFCGTRLVPGEPGAAASATRPRPETFVPASDRARLRDFPGKADSAAVDTGGRGIWGFLGFALAAIIALVAGGWLAFYLNHRRQAAPIAQASPAASAASSPAVNFPVRLAKTIPIQVSGDRSAPLRDPNALAKVFADRSVSLGEAFGRAREASPTFSDGMILRLHVLPDGHVGDGSVRVSTSPNPSLDAETVRVANDWKFPPTAGGAVDVDYPVVFAPSDADAAPIESDLKTRVASLAPSEAAEYALSPSPGASSVPAEAAASPAATSSAPEVAALPPAPGAEATTSIPPPTTAPARHHKARAPRYAALKPPIAGLRERISNELAANRRLRRVQLYTSGGNVTLYGKVFNDDDKLLAERTARRISGVTSVTDNLTTDAADWAATSDQINRRLQSAGLDGVTAKVIGKSAYLSGSVRTDLDKERAVTIAQAAAPVVVRENLIRVEPGNMFGF